MKIIDLLNKIANGEEVPNFWWNGCIHEVQKEYGTNKYSIFDTYCKKYKKIELEDLNDTVEILEEEKKIPGKLKIEQDTPSSNYYIRNENGTKCALTKHSKMIAETLNQLIDYLDYLKSKGE